MGLKFFDYVWFPWTVSKWTWEKFRPQKPQEPGRVPQMSCYGRPLSLVYGRTRVTGNVIYFEDTYAPLYPATRIMVAICEGPIAGIDRVWRDKDCKNVADWQLDVLTGTRPTQTAWTHLPAGKILGYPGIAMVAQNALRIAAASIGQMSFEVRGLLTGTGGSSGDANPAEILGGTVASPGNSMLLRTDFGAGFPWEVVVETGRDGNANTSYRRYVEQNGFWLSPALTDQRPAREWLAEILKATNSDCVWSGAASRVVPLG